ncbi:MAG: 1-acyl-sn-glycerol-3-phosphate acyltransferase [Clostridiales bacterium]|nr:1-acyl-sn-glycerol-3-phosphate acyltransferase [Clostridiales bacterium]
MKKKKTKWIKFRHKVVTGIVRFVLRPYCRLVYGVKAEPFRQQEKRPYLILYNHQTTFDQFFLGISFKGPVYYVATEDIFSNGFVSSLIRWLVNPIPIKKQTGDVAAVKNCIRVSREGGSIAIAPEGNRTYSGRTEYMSPAIASLARMMKMPIALYRIEGGYGVQPRWSDGVRRGRMRSYVSEVILPGEYENMTNDELLERIVTGLQVNEDCADGLFRSKKRAEYLERAMYVCPFCGLAKFESKGAESRCLSCGKTILYGEDKRITGKDCDFPFEFVAQWYDYQKKFVNALDVTADVQKPLFEDRANLSEVIVYKRKELLRKDAHIRLYGDRVAIDEDGGDPLILPFAEITAAAVLGRNKLNLYHGGKVYQFKGDKHFNALKYVNICYRCKNIQKGDVHGEFLGL